MYCLTLAKTTAALWLSAIDLLTVPLRVLVQTPELSDNERQELQEEVWDAWKEQPEPLQEVVFQ
ncbi:MAG: hypothetical protein P1P84_16000 [Deferrisomatales bacterium]|nr:hypothetical protein [Deferrisomatales bacterium]